MGAGLRERYHAELSELKAARSGAADAQRMRERLDSVQLSNDALVAARCADIAPRARMNSCGAWDCMWVCACVHAHAPHAGGWGGGAADGMADG